MRGTIPEIYKEKRSGPRTEPCGTPEIREEKVEGTDPKETRIIRLLRKEFSNESAVSLMPKESWRHWFISS